MEMQPNKSYTNAHKISLIRGNRRNTLARSSHPCAVLVCLLFTVLATTHHHHQQQQQQQCFPCSNNKLPPKAADNKQPREPLGMT